MEGAIQEAGRQAMRAALQQAVRAYVAAHAACPRCGGAQISAEAARRWTMRLGLQASDEQRVDRTRVRALNATWDDDHLPTHPAA